MIKGSQRKKPLGYWSGKANDQKETSSKRVTKITNTFPPFLFCCPFWIWFVLTKGSQNLSLVMGHPREIATEEANRELSQHHRDAADGLLRGKWRGRRGQHPGDGGHDQADRQAADGKLPDLGQVGPGWLLH